MYCILIIIPCGGQAAEADNAQRRKIEAAQRAAAAHAAAAAANGTANANNNTAALQLQHNANNKLHARKHQVRDGVRVSSSRDWSSSSDVLGLVTINPLQLTYRDNTMRSGQIWSLNP